MHKINIDKILKLSDADWLKLRKFSKAISAKLKTRLPCDWYLTQDDIQSAVYGTFIKLLQSYRPGTMSPASYCWQYGERATYSTLMREYRRLKDQLPLDDVENPSDEEDGECTERHQHAKYKVNPCKPLSEHIEQSSLAEQVQEIAEANGLGKIARMLKTMT